MFCRMGDLRNKYVINVRNGSKGEQGDPGVDGADLSTEVEALDARITENYNFLYDLIMAAAGNINALEERVTALEGGS